jgi:hypothetical protein
MEDPSVKKITFLIRAGVFLGAVFCFPISISHAEPSGEEIIKKSQAAFYAAGDAMKARIKMRLINPAMKVRERDLAMLRKNTGPGEQRYFMYFHAPGDVRGTSFMVWKYSGRDDDRWLFVPALKLVRRIAAKDSQSSFVGSDFTYEDISGRDPDLDTHTLIRDESCDSRTCYVVESIPKDQAVFTKKLAWIEIQTFLPIREEYYDLQGELERVFTAVEINEIGNIPTVTKRQMENVRRKHRTEVTFDSVTYTIDLPAQLFSERSLRQPPREWIE